MAKPIITLNGLKIVIMLGMLVIILCGIRFAAEIIVPFILALFIAVILNPLVQHMVRWRVPRVLAVSILMTIIVMAMVLLLAYLGSALNELTRTLPQYRNSIMTPLQAIEPLLQRIGIDVSVDQLAHYIDPNAAMTLLTNLLTQLSNAMSSIFLLLLTVLFMLLEVPQLPGKFQQMMARPVEGMAAIQRAIDSVSHYLVRKQPSASSPAWSPGRCSPHSMFASLLSGDCWPLRLITSRILVQFSRQSPLSLRYWCLMASTKRCWCWRDIC